LVNLVVDKATENTPLPPTKPEQDVKILMGQIRLLTNQISDLQETVGALKHRMAEIESKERINELRWERREGPRGDTKYGT